MGNGMHKDERNDVGISEIAQKVIEAERLSKYYKNPAYYYINFKRARHRILVTINDEDFVMTTKEFNMVYNIMLDMLPEVVESKVSDLQPSYDIDIFCEICFQKFKSKDIKGLSCGHGPYHEPCIKKWMKIGHTCPMCRRLEYITNWTGKELQSNLNTTINTFVSIIKNNSKHV